MVVADTRTYCRIESSDEEHRTALRGGPLLRIAVIDVQGDGSAYGCQPTQE